MTVQLLACGTRSLRRRLIIVMIRKLGMNRIPYSSVFLGHTDLRV